MISLLKYMNRLIIAFSILLNVFLGGKSNQTFSARNWGWKLKGYPNFVWFIDFIFFFDLDHCKKAWEFWHKIQKHYKDISFFR